MACLSTSEIEQYRSEGGLIPQFSLPQPRVAQMREALDPEIVELVSGVIGDDVILWGCHDFCKPPREGYETPWHQDGRVEMWRGGW